MCQTKLGVAFLDMLPFFTTCQVKLGVAFLACCKRTSFLVCSKKSVVVFLPHAKKKLGVENGNVTICLYSIQLIGVYRY